LLALLTAWIIIFSYVCGILKNEIMVAEEFWDFIGGEGAYQDLLNIFERVGIELRPEIDNYFTRYNRQN
jgi:type II restriction enzyme